MEGDEGARGNNEASEETRREIGREKMRGDDREGAGKTMEGKLEAGREVVGHSLRSRNVLPSKDTRE